jgi:hypothetical protein
MAGCYGSSAVQQAEDRQPFASGVRADARWADDQDGAGGLAGDAVCDAPREKTSQGAVGPGRHDDQVDFFLTRHADDLLRNAAEDNFLSDQTLSRKILFVLLEKSRQIQARLACEPVDLPSQAFSIHHAGFVGDRPKREIACDVQDQ